MPVDFLPLLLLAGLIPAVLLIALLVTVFSGEGKVKGDSKRKGLRVWLIAFFTIALIGGIYGYMYKWTEIRHSKAAKSGDIEAMYTLGASFMHYRRGSRFDPDQGIKYITQAAEGGNVNAQLKLASHFLTGVSATVNKELALKWYKEAANKGNRDGKKMLKLLSEKEYYPENPSGEAGFMAFKWIEQ